MADCKALPELAKEKTAGNHLKRPGKGKIIRIKSLAPSSPFRPGRELKLGRESITSVACWFTRVV